MELYKAGDLDVSVTLPEGLVRLANQNLVDLTPWHLLSRDAALEKLHSLRKRYASKYVPFAYRQDNDDVACIDPEHPEEVLIVHDYASQGSERSKRYDSFWDWFRAVVEDMVVFE